MSQVSIGQLSNQITGGVARVHGLGQGLLKDIDPAKAAQMPEGINCNHPVFIYGHLAIYPQIIMKMLGAEPGETAVPESYNNLFMHGIECQDDTDNTVYPSLDEVVANYTRSYETLIEFVKTVDDATLAKDIEGNDGFKDAFGTNGVMVMFLIHDHPMFHLGQLSTWRRAMGLGSAM